MPSAARPSPYEVLGVDPAAAQDEVRRAYRRRLRETHPDTGGDPASFQAVQDAWEHVGDPARRADYDRGASSPRFDAPRAHGGPMHRRADAAPKARAYGHPGGWARVRFLQLMREWAGRGEDVDPYDPALVSRAPAEIRRLLAEAVAEESTASTVASLGIGFTLFSDVDAEGGKLDHVVLGPTGLVGLYSEDWGAPVKLVRGELRGPGLAEDERPLKSLARDARAVSRQAGVRFSLLVVVVPDEDLPEPILEAHAARGRHPATVVIRRSLLPWLLTRGPGEHRLSVGDSFEVRSRLVERLRYL